MNGLGYYSIADLNRYQTQFELLSCLQSRKHVPLLFFEHLNLSNIYLLGLISVEKRFFMEMSPKITKGKSTDILGYEFGTTSL